jgi:hypothetical protein
LLANVLVFQGRTLDGKWRVLDFARTSNTLNTDDKLRVDRILHHSALVDCIRISAIGVDGGMFSPTHSNPVWFPQIQIFAGVPILPRMASAQEGNVRIIASGDAGHRVFDKAVSGNNVASVGFANWYMNMGGTPNNDVASDGIIRRFYNDDIVNSAMSLSWLTILFPPSRLIGYLYSIDNLSGIHADTPYAASLYFEGRETASESVAMADSESGGWDEIGLISLDKCIGNNTNPSTAVATFNTWVDNMLKLTGSDRNKAYLINHNGNILQYNDSAKQWQDKGRNFTSETDAIHDVDNQTHYADFAEAQTWAQLRFTVKSIMNVYSLTIKHHVVAMPEMQLFGLPADPINTGTVATVSYLKAEDASGKLHDMLGRYATLPWRTTGTSTSFRFYIGTADNILATDRRLHLAIQNTSGQMVTGNASLDAASTPHRDISLTGNHSTSPVYFELFIRSENNEKIILSSGYTGERT